MSPTLFNLYLANLGEETGKEKEGDIVIGKEKLWALTRRKGTERNDCKILEICKEEKDETKHRKVEGNGVRKGGRKRKRESIGEGGRIEEVKEIKYLGRWQKNGGAEGHIKDRVRR